MTPLFLPFRSRIALRILLTGAAASLLTGCADSERFTNPFSNPFQQANQATDPAPTGSLPPATAAPVAPVSSRPLSSQVQARPIPASAPVAPVHTAMTQSPSKPVSARPAGWSITGGSPVIVAQDENAHSLSDRYGVPVEALVHTNGFTSAAQIQPGTHLVVPVYNAGLAASSGAKVAVEPPHPIPLRTEHARAEPVKPAETPAPAKSEQLAKSKEIAKEPLKVAKKGPGAPPANLAEPKAAPVHAAKAQLAKPRPSVAAKPEEPKKLAAKSIPVQEKPLTAEKAPAKVKEARLQEAKPQEMPRQQMPKAEPAPQAAAAPETEKPSDNANPEFRWPARGRIIQGFKSGGNDGINIAVPEGTAVKAAEGGVVAYAGNELKGYGNLVLIRHPNGYVTAYANNADIEVKRGETVKRGQVIAKSGQTGNVASPQLHFELRKGATPVDPTQYLAGL